MPRNILILDDQEDILLVLEREFRRRPGVSVTATTKTTDALRLVSEKRIELIISDVRLGLESGFDFVRNVKRSHPDVAAILMSAYRSPTNRLQAEDLGVVLFLEKPFQISRLVEEVENYFIQRENPAPVAAPTPTVAVAHAPVANPSAEMETNELAHFKPQDLVQLFCLNGRNVVLTVASAQHLLAGKIYIQRGRVLHADFNGKTGEVAFYALMQLRDSRLKVKDWTEPVPVTIETSWEHLLLQSAVQADHHDDNREEPPLRDSKQAAG